MATVLHKPRRNACGFTIIELTISMVIVLILCALAIGAWQSSVQNSHSAQCQQRLRNLANAGLLYATENNGKLPDRSRWNYATVASKPLSLLPYMGLELDENPSAAMLEKLLLCPAAKHSEYKPSSESKSYSINQYATGSDVGSNDTWESQVRDRESPLRLINVKSPSTQAFFMDGTYVNDGFGKRFSVFQDSIRLTAREDIMGGGWQTPFLHGDAIFVVFLDGHVERITREYAEAELIGPANPSASQAHTSPRTRPFWGAGK